MGRKHQNKKAKRRVWDPGPMFLDEEVRRKYRDKVALHEGTYLRTAKGKGCCFEIVVALPNGNYYIQFIRGKHRIKCSREWTPHDLRKCRIVNPKWVEAMSLAGDMY